MPKIIEVIILYRTTLLTQIVKKSFVICDGCLSTAKCDNAEKSCVVDKDNFDFNLK